MRCFGFLISLISTSLVLAIVPGFGEDQSRSSNSQSATKTFNEGARRDVNLLIQRTLDRTNARDLDGLMRCYWRSPDLIYVENEQITVGWDSVRNLLSRRYSNRTRFGMMVAEKIVVQTIASNLMAGVVWWTIQYPTSDENGTLTLVCAKIDENWYIISSSMTRL
jgi:hypothetical protein